MLSKMTRASETALPAADGAGSGSGGRLSRLSLFGSSPLSLSRKVAVDSSSNNEGINGEDASDENDEVVQELSDRGVSSSPSHRNTAVHSSDTIQQGTATTSGDAQVSTNEDAQVSSIRAASATTGS